MTYKESAICCLKANQQIKDPSLVNLIGDIFSSTILFDLFSIQPMPVDTDEGEVFYLQYNENGPSPITVESEAVDLNDSPSLTIFDEFSDDFTPRKLAQDMERNVFAWLASTVEQTVLDGYIWEKLKTAKHKVNFAITPITNFLQMPPIGENTTNKITYLGKHHNVAMYEDPLLDNKIILGYKGESYLDSGAIFSPLYLEASRNQGEITDLCLKYKMFLTKPDNYSILNIQ